MEGNKELNEKILGRKRGLGPVRRVHLMIKNTGNRQRSGDKWHFSLRGKSMTCEFFLGLQTFDQFSSHTNLNCTFLPGNFMSNKFRGSQLEEAQTE